MTDNIINKLRCEVAQIEDLRTQGRSIKGSIINEFLWTCAGADKDLLRMCTKDQSKIAGKGGCILFASIFAAISGCILFQMCVYNWLIALLFGILFGLLVFNLERYLINSMFNDGKSTISLQELVSGLPRILIAILLGIVISTPLELLMFSGEIDEHIRIEVIKTSEGSLSEIDSRIADCKQNLEVARENERRAWEAYNYEIIGSENRIAGYGPMSKQKEELWQKAKSMSEKYENKLVELQNLRDKEFSAIQNTTQKSYNSLATRIKALNKVADFSSDVFWPRILCMLLCIILMVTPILNEIMLSYGKYELLLSKEINIIQKISLLEHESTLLNNEQENG